MSFRGLARWCLGITGWRDDFDQAVQMVKTAEAVTRGGVLYYTYTMSILHGVLRPGDAILHEMTEILSSAEQTGEDVAFGLAKSNVAFALLHRDGQSRPYALEMLGQNSRHRHAAAVVQNRNTDDRCVRRAGPGAER